MRERLNELMDELNRSRGQTIAIGKLNKGEVVDADKLRGLFVEWKKRVAAKSDGTSLGRFYWPATAYCEVKRDVPDYSEN